MQVSSIVVSASLFVGEGLVMAMLLGQTMPQDVASYLQFGLGSGLAAFLVMYEIPRQRKEDRELNDKIVERYEKRQEEASERFHAELAAMRQAHAEQITQLCAAIQCRGAQGALTPPRA